LGVAVQEGRNQDEPFHLGGGKTAQVPTMRQTGHFRLVRENGMAAIELPYADDELSMIVILPGGDAEKLGESLSLDQVKQLGVDMFSQEVDVFLPRFKLDTRYLPGSNLGDVGMPDAFRENLADFKGITGGEDLSISSVIHQAMIDVNEEGSDGRSEGYEERGDSNERDFSRGPALHLPDRPQCDRFDSLLRTRVERSG
jgi:serpin B